VVAGVGAAMGGLVSGCRTRVAERRRDEGWRGEGRVTGSVEEMEGVRSSAEAAGPGAGEGAETALCAP
jgi:hypothetical protein